MEFDGGADRLGDTLKLCQNGISCLMDFPATMRCNHIGEQVEASIKLSVGFLLIESSKTTVTGNVSNGGLR